MTITNYDTALAALVKQRTGLMNDLETLDVLIDWLSARATVPAEPAVFVAQAPPAVTVDADKWATADEPFTAVTVANGRGGWETIKPEPEITQCVPPNLAFPDDEPDGYPCECGRTFKTVAARGSHRIHCETFRASVKELWTCTRCPKTFTTKRGRDRHTNKCDYVKPDAEPLPPVAQDYKCFQCASVFPNARHLELHGQKMGHIVDRPKAVA